MTSTRIFQGFRVATMQGEAGYGLLEDATVVVRNGEILRVRTGAAGSVGIGDAEVIRGGGALLTPGLIDCHTHLVYAGSRAGEFAERLRGTSYDVIARRGGGIVSTVRATRQASFDELLTIAEGRARSWLRQGVTTVEIKSGYGLDVETECRMLAVARGLADRLPLTVVATALPAHAVPPEFQGRNDDYIRLVCDTILPRLAEYADAVDVFCEHIAFDVRQSEQVLRRGLELGLTPRIHAEQRSLLGGAAMAASLGARSADHLEYLDRAGVESLARNGTVATLLPAAFYFLRESQPPPIAQLREAGVPIALASDLNPGSAPVGSFLLVLNLACVLYGLTAEEALAGVTRHAARALGLESRLGTIEEGRQADLVVWNVDDPAELSYRIAENPCRAVYQRGECVYEAPL